MRSSIMKWNSLRLAMALLTMVCLVGGLWTLLPRPAHAASSNSPIRVGVIAAFSTPAGKGVVSGAKLAATKINAGGGVNGRPIKLFVYDDQLQSTKAVRDFQRLVQQDKVVAVVGLIASEVALAVEPWSGRLKTPLIITGSASPEISKRIHNHYEQYKYAFTMLPSSAIMARQVCAFTHHTLVENLGAKDAVLLSEDAKWTKPFDKELVKCLPKAGVKVDKRIRFSLDTSDFTPIFGRIQAIHPDLIITALSHSGLQATVQWAHEKIPALMVGMNVVAMSQGFWQRSNGAVQGVVTLAQGAPHAPLTPKTKPYRQAFIKRFGHKVAPGLAVPTFDAMHILANAVERAGTTNPDVLVKALEQTDYVGAGSAGHIRFRDRNSPLTHDSTYHLVLLQWQDGKRVPVWPPKVAQPLILPSFARLKTH